MMPQRRKNFPHVFRDCAMLRLHFGRFFDPQGYDPPCDSVDLSEDYEVPVKIKINLRSSKASQPIRHSLTATIKALTCHDKPYFHIQPNQPIIVAVKNANFDCSAELKLTIQVDRTLDGRPNHTIPLVSCDPFRQADSIGQASRILMRGSLPSTPATVFILGLARTVDTSGQNHSKIVVYDPAVALEVCHHWTDSHDTSNCCSHLPMQTPRSQLEKERDVFKTKSPRVMKVKPMSPIRKGTSGFLPGEITPDEARPFGRFKGRDNDLASHSQHRKSVLLGRSGTPLKPYGLHLDQAGGSVTTSKVKQGSSASQLPGAEIMSPDVSPRYRQGISVLSTPHISISPSPVPTVETEDMSDIIDSSRLRKRRKPNPDCVTVDEIAGNEESKMFATPSHNRLKPRDLRRYVAASRLSPSAVIQRGQIARPREASTSTSATDRGARSTSEAVSSVTSYEDVLSDARKSELGAKRDSSSAMKSSRRPTPRAAATTTTTDMDIAVPIYNQAMPFQNTLPTRTKERFWAPKAPDKASFYKSVTKTKIQAGEVVSESDDDNGRSQVWQRLKDDNELDIRHGPNDSQKSFMKLWNRHIRHEDLHADKYVAESWLRFARTYAEELGKEAMLSEFCIRAGLEKMDGRLTDEVVSQSIKIVTDASTHDKIEPSATAQTAWHAGCICGVVLTDMRDCVVCSNEECVNPDFHLACVNLMKRPGYWLCPSCQTV